MMRFGVLACLFMPGAIAQSSFELCRNGDCCLTPTGASSCNINGWTLGFTETPLVTFSAKGPDNSLQYEITMVPTPGSTGQWTGFFKFPGSQSQGCSGDCGNWNPLCENSGSCTCSAQANLQETVQATKQNAHVSNSLPQKAFTNQPLVRDTNYQLCRGSGSSDCCITEPGSTSCRTESTGLQINWDAGTSSITAAGPVAYTLNLMQNQEGAWSGTMSFSASYDESCSFGCGNVTPFCFNGPGHCSATVNEDANEVVSVAHASSQATELV